MPRIFSRLTVTLLTFIIGITLAGVWQFLSRPAIKSGKIAELNSVAPPVVQTPRFIPVGYACGFVCSSQTYNSSDGEVLSDSTCSYRSHARAKKELQRDLKGVQKIVERAAKSDWKGLQIGERVVAIFPPDEYERRRVRIMWTDGSRLRSINAPSLQLALEFEQKEGRWN
jgi:hypothetical protein